ncbi:hypothetical protein [Reichenbachiella versicolor]|uniref:hypothetical protein n=1 Tax=Reichenbachiella versicolor TaxID=1821036 RepID=UPI000D6E6545|nr:hypothetical protein [Reichenbachiella versicolor]
MDSDKLDEILERYYNGTSTDEDEEVLKVHFQSSSEDNVDQRLFQQLSEVNSPVPDDLFDEMDQVIESEWEKENKLKFKSIYLWASSIAAVLIVALGIMFYPQEDPTLLADTYQDPEVAYLETQKVLLLISSTMKSNSQNLKYLSSIDQSLSHCSKISKINSTINTIKSEND